MLRKLMKHEWIATRRILLPVNLTILLITCIGCIFLGTDILQGENSLPLVVLLIILYALSMLVLCMVSSIYLLVRFYKNLFSREGYLMFTLPVTPAQLLNSKLIVALLWSFFNSLLMIASIFALGFSSGYYVAGHSSSTDKSAFLTGLLSALSGEAQDSVSFQEVFGYTPLELLLLCTVCIIISAFFSMVMGYLAIALGQLIEKYKVACSIAFYIALYICTQIITSIIMIVVNIDTLLGDTQAISSLTGSIYQTVLPSSAILNLILGILFYIITSWILHKKINLD